jgi:hypothetical protein
VTRKPCPSQTLCSVAVVLPSIDASGSESDVRLEASSLTRRGAMLKLILP